MGLYWSMLFFFFEYWKGGILKVYISCEIKELIYFSNLLKYIMIYLLNNLLKYCNFLML